MKCVEQVLHKARGGRRPSTPSRIFEGLELVEPGVVSVTRWRPRLVDVDGGLPPEVGEFGGVARKA